MECSDEPSFAAFGLHRKFTAPRPRSSDPLDNPNNQTDSFLTAARLIRRGWTPSEKKTGWQNSHCKTGYQGPKRAEISLKEPRSTVSWRKAAEVCPEKQQDEVKQNGVEASQQQASGGVSTSSCRIICRRYRRFKAPILPVIIEV